LGTDKNYGAEFEAVEKRLESVEYIPDNCHVQDSQKESHSVAELANSEKTHVGLGDVGLRGGAGTDAEFEAAE
jgi:hypothetical protein